MKKNKIASKIFIVFMLAAILSVIFLLLFIKYKDEMIFEIENFYELSNSIIELGMSAMIGISALSFSAMEVCKLDKSKKRNNLKEYIRLIFVMLSILISYKVMLGVAYLMNIKSLYIWTFVGLFIPTLIILGSIFILFNDYLYQIEK